MKIETQERLERPAYDEGLILESRGPGQREAIDTSAISLGYAPTLAARSGKEGAGAAAERRLALRVYTHCHSFIEEACRMSSLPTSFLGALTASESGGDALAVRFEPGVYRHLKGLAAGQAHSYTGIDAPELNKELAAMLHPKAGGFHASFLNSPTTSLGQELASREDEALRELASSWGYTQIMGYHLIGRRAAVSDLREPRFHYRLALELLAQFAEAFQLDLRLEFAELFSCWNTGRPDGTTFDPKYVHKGLYRMQLYHELASTRASHS